MEDVPEDDEDHHHGQDEDVDYHHGQVGEDGDGSDDDGNMIFSHCLERGELLKGEI